MNECHCESGKKTVLIWRHFVQAVNLHSFNPQPSVDHALRQAFRVVAASGDPEPENYTSGPVLELLTLTVSSGLQ